MGATLSAGIQVTRETYEAMTKDSSCKQDHAILKKQIGELLQASTAENHASFFTPLGIDNHHRADFMRRAIDDYASRIQIMQAVSPPIPRTIARLWLTNPATPALPKNEYIRQIASRARRLGDTYRNVFWHNSAEVAEHLKAELDGLSFDFVRIEALSQHPECFDKIQRAIDARKFVLAGDICKYLIISCFGGVYADLGVDFDEALLDLSMKGGISLFLDQNIFFQPAYMAAAPNAAPFTEWCRILRQPEVLSSISCADRDRLTPGTEIWMHGGVGFTANLLLHYDGSYSVLPIPANRGLLSTRSDGSWYKAGNQFGNVGLNEAPVTHLDFDLHREMMRNNALIDAALPGIDLLDRSRLKLELNKSRLYR